MKSSASKIQMTSYDDLFQGESVGNESGERVQEIALTELHTFKNHPFQVRDDEEMQKTVESVVQYGVLVPAIARPRAEGGYELVAGHRRKHASELAGKTTMPVLVRDLDDDESTIIMVDSNIQRESVLPSEKAWAYKMKLDALKRQGARNDLTLARAVPKLPAREQVAQDAGEKSGMMVTRYISLTQLIPPLLDLVDSAKFSVSTAADYISPLVKKEQEWLFSKMTSLCYIPTASQLSRLKKYSQDGKLDENVIDAILTEERAAPIQVTLKKEKLTQYFPKTYTQIQIEEVIFSLLETWKTQQA